MFVVTTAADAEPAGCLVGFATQCSIDPARFLTCISKRNHTYRVAARAEVLVVHFLAREDLHVAELFGENTSDDVDKFSHCGWEPGPEGAPVLKGGRGWMAGRILDRLDMGDHVGFVLEPLANETRAQTSTQLGFQQVRHLRPGHEA